MPRSLWSATARWSLTMSALGTPLMPRCCARCPSSSTAARRWLWWGPLALGNQLPYGSYSGNPIDPDKARKSSTSILVNSGLRCVSIAHKTPSFQTCLDIACLAEWIVYTACQMDTFYVMTEQCNRTAGGMQQLCRQRWRQKKCSCSVNVPFACNRIRTLDTLHDSRLQHIAS